MKRKAAIILVVVCAALCLVVCPPTDADEKEMTITGTVTDDFQILADDGTVYEIGIGEIGDQLGEHIGKKITATGLVDNLQGLFVIYVTSFTVTGS